jgi:hypothetical protein
MYSPVLERPMSDRACAHLAEFDENHGRGSKIAVLRVLGAGVACDEHVGGSLYDQSDEGPLRSGDHGLRLQLDCALTKLGLMVARCRKPR